VKRVTLEFAVFAVLVLAIGACRNPSAPDQSVILDVSKLDAPASAASGDPLPVVLTVTTGGCRTFDHIEARRDASSATLTAWGRDVSIGRKGIGCTAELRLEPHTYQFDPPFANPFTIAVSRGRLAPLTATVQVQ
jgi:hypothetical protein